MKLQHKRLLFIFAQDTSHCSALARDAEERFHDFALEIYLLQKGKAAFKF